MTDTRLSTSTAEIILSENGIAEFRALPSKTDEFNLAEVKEVLELVANFVDTHRFYLVEIKNGKFSHDARKFIAAQDNIADKVAMVLPAPFKPC